MNFESMMGNLRNGHQMRRERWALYTYIAIQYPHENSIFTNPFIYLKHNEMVIPCNMDAWDLFAEDWEIYKGA